MKEPCLIVGDSITHARGRVSFVNDFSFPDVKRFYLIQNHENLYVRAWQGHQKERKYFFVIKGKAFVCAIKIDNWQEPSPDLEIKKYLLKEESPSVLCVPEGYANGIMNVSNESKIVVFSTSTLAETKLDDFRWKAYFWNPWDELREKMNNKSDEVLEKKWMK